MAKAKRLPEPVATALAIAQEVAHGHGLEAKHSDHWEETIEIAWQEEGLWRIAVLWVYRFRVSGTLRIPDGDHSALVSRSFGSVDPTEGGWEQKLRHSLQQTWEWLTSQDRASVLALDSADKEHARSRIIPILQAFAAQENLAIGHADRGVAILEWPAENPKYRLGLNYARGGGLYFSGYHFVARRRLFRKARVVPVACGDFEDLQQPDWTKLDDLPDRLAEARRRLEQCMPTKDAPETYLLHYE